MFSEFNVELFSESNLVDLRVVDTNEYETSVEQSDTNHPIYFQK